MNSKHFRKSGTKRMREIARDLGIGENCEKMLEVARDIANGKLADPLEGGFVAVSPKLRLDAAAWLTERVLGKAHQSVSVDTGGGGYPNQAKLLSQFSDEELSTMNRLLTKGQAVEADFKIENDPGQLE